MSIRRLLPLFGPSRMHRVRLLRAEGGARGHAHAREGDDAHRRARGPRRRPTGGLRHGHRRHRATGRAARACSLTFTRAASTVPLPARRPTRARRAGAHRCSSVRTRSPWRPTTPRASACGSRCRSIATSRVSSRSHRPVRRRAARSRGRPRAGAAHAALRSRAARSCRSTTTRRPARDRSRRRRTTA